MRCFMGFVLVGLVGCDDGDLAREGARTQSSAVATNTRTHVPSVPIIGGTLLALPHDQGIVAAAPGEDELIFWSAAMDGDTRHTLLPKGSMPTRLVASTGTEVHVVLRGTGAIATIDTETGAVTANEPVCNEPRGIDFDERDETLSVSCAEGLLLRVDPGTLAVLEEQQLPDDLRDVVVDGDHRYVSRFKTAEVLLVTPDGDYTTQRPTDLYREPHQFEPAVGWRLIAHPEGGAVLVHQRAMASDLPAGELVIMDPEPPKIVYYGPPEPPDTPSCAGIVHSAATHFRAGEEPRSSGSLAIPPLPVDIAIDPKANRMMIVSAGFAPLNALSWRRAVNAFDLAVIDDSVGCIAGAPAPIEPEESLGLVTSIALTTDGQVALLDRYPMQLRAGERAASVLGSTDRTVERAVTTLHRDTGKGIACASCHPEGLEDGRVWAFPFPFGPRRTQSLATGLADSAPYHWRGELESFKHLVLDVMVDRMDGTYLSTANREGLLQWLDGLPAPRYRTDRDSPQVLLGETLFAETGCDSCHIPQGAPLQDLFDVGTGGAFVVPSLRGVGARAPFLHDGCAATLEERFLCGGDQHGEVDDLTEEDLQALIAYLQTL